MSQISSKRPAKLAARAQRRTLGRGVQARPATDIRNLRPLAQRQAEDNAGNVSGLPGSEGSATEQSAVCRQSYLHWAGFVVGNQSADFGFGAYFVDDKASGANDAQSSAWMTKYTWTPAGRG
jgi:hypothetical protein